MKIRNKEEKETEDTQKLELRREVEGKYSKIRNKEEKETEDTRKLGIKK